MEQHNNDIGTIEDFCKYRIDLAKSDLKAAKILFENNEYRGANCCNRGIL